MSTRITKSFSFDAAHRLPNVPEGHRCGRMHGHTYTVVIGLEGEIDPHMGWIVDFGEIKAVFGPVMEELDHRCLNEIPGLENPTAEVLARWIHDRIRPDLPQLADVTVQETPTSAAIYRP